MATNDSNQQGKSVIKLFHDGKSGLEGLDSDFINKTINDVTRGSNFYNHKLAKEKKIEARVNQMKEQIENSNFIDRENARKIIEQLKYEYRTMGKDLSHIIVHIDMDMFFVAVEIRDNPDLADKPVAVGSSSMISTSNYVARKFGVRAGMPGFIGLKLCKELQLIPGHFHKYKEESRKITEVMKEYDETFVPYSLDECSIDLTSYLVKKCSMPDSKIKIEIKKNDQDEFVLSDEVWRLADQVVQELRQKVFERTQLTCSAGIAPNKMLAKICSDINKPNGSFILKGTSCYDIISFIQKFNVKKIPGIGPVQQLTLRGFEIETVKDLYANLEKLCLVYSSLQIDYFTRVSMGVSSFEMHTDEPAKSESREETFRATKDSKFLLETLRTLCEALSSRLIQNIYNGKTITLKIKKENFQVNVRSKTIYYYLNDADTLFEIGKKLLLKEMSEQETQFRLLGIRLSNFQENNEDKQARIVDLFKKNSEQLKATVLSTSASSKSSELNDSADSTMYDQIDQPNTNQFDSQEDILNNYLANQSDQSSQEAIVNVEQNEEQTEEDSSYLCPVCEARRFSELDKLNEHVDYCLSRQTIIQEINDIESVITDSTGKLEVSSSSTKSSAKKRSKSSASAIKENPTKKKNNSIFQKSLNFSHLFTHGSFSSAKQTKTIPFFKSLQILMLFVIYFTLILFYVMLIKTSRCILIFFSNICQLVATKLVSTSGYEMNFSILLSNESFYYHFDTKNKFVFRVRRGFNKETN